MAQTAAPDTAVVEAKGLIARLFGVVVTPRAAYADVAARPRALGATLVILLLACGSTFAFLSTDVGKNAMLDQQRQSMESFGFKMNEQQMQRMEQGAARAPYVGAI